VLLAHRPNLDIKDNADIQAIVKMLEWDDVDLEARSNDGEMGTYIGSVLLSVRCVCFVAAMPT
jgi:hypothetical protein